MNFSKLEPMDILILPISIDWFSDKTKPKILRFIGVWISCIIWIPFLVILILPVAIWELWREFDELF